MNQAAEKENLAKLRIARNKSRLSLSAMNHVQGSGEGGKTVNDKENRSAVKETASAISRVAKGPKYKAPIEAIKLGLRLRALSEGHAKAPWIIAIGAAFVADGIVIIPGIGWLFSFSIKVGLFFFMVGRGAGIKQWKTRVMRRALIMLLIDAIPFIGDILPLTVFSILYIKRKSAKESQRAAKKADEIEKAIKRQQKVFIDESDMEDYPAAA